MREPITFLYTNNKKIGSKIISWACRDHGQKRAETPSHFSILLFDWIIIESTLAYGIEPKLYSKFLDQNTILAAFVPVDGKMDAAKIAKGIADKNKNAKYDFAAAIYLGWHSMMRYYFKSPLPKKNRFDDSEDFFCNEIYADLYGGDVSMKHPNWLMKDMERDDKLIKL